MSGVVAGLCRAARLCRAASNHASALPCCVAQALEAIWLLSGIEPSGPVESPESGGAAAHVRHHLILPNTEGAQASTN